MKTVRSTFHRHFDLSGLIVGGLGLYVALAIANADQSRPVTPPSLQAEAYYADGIFHQKVTPLGLDVIQADWSSSIYQGEKYICGGVGGVGSYSGQWQGYDPNDWTFDDCSKMVIGQKYDAIASWERVGPDGLLDTVSVKFEFIHSEAL